MIFEVFLFYNDMFGGVMYYHDCFIEANSISEVKEKFPDNSFLCGWNIVKRIDLKEIPKMQKGLSL